MDGFSEFGGHGRVFEPEIRRHWGDIYDWNSKGMGDFRYGISTGHRQECILENTYFIDSISSQIKHELATLATQDTRQALINNEASFCVHLQEKPTKRGLNIKLQRP